MLYSNLDVSEMFVDRQAQRSSMHTRHLNEQLVRVLKTIGYDVGFQKGQGQYLYDLDGASRPGGQGDGGYEMPVLVHPGRLLWRELKAAG